MGPRGTTLEQARLVGLTGIEYSSGRAKSPGFSSFNSCAPSLYWIANQAVLLRGDYLARLADTTAMMCQA